MTIKEVINLFKETFPSLESRELKRVGEWYVFIIINGPKDDFGGLQVPIDPYVGYNTKTNEWDHLTPSILGEERFFKSKSIVF